MGKIKMNMELALVVMITYINIVCCQRPLSNSSISTSFDTAYQYPEKEKPRSGRVLLPRPISTQSPVSGIQIPIVTHTYSSQSSGSENRRGSAPIMDHAYGGNMIGTGTINNNYTPYRPRGRKKNIADLRKQLSLNSTGTNNHYYGAAAGGAAGGGGSSGLMYRPPVNDNGNGEVDDSDSFTNIRSGPSVGFENQGDDPSYPTNDPVRIIKDKFQNYVSYIIFYKYIHTYHLGIY